MVKFTIFTVRLSEDTVKMLRARSIQTNEPMSSMVRRLIVQGVSQETAGENAPEITVIRRETTKDVEGVVQKENDRLARLVVKTMKAAAASMYLAAQAAGDSDVESRKLLDDALGMATKYVKLPYSLPDAGEGDPKPETESQEQVSITEEEFFELCFGTGERSSAGEQ